MNHDSKYQLSRQHHRFIRRLSQEDALDGESNSIANQKKILLKYSTDNGFPNPTFFIDDGVSGVTFDRPGWNEMIRLTEVGKVKSIIVKDMFHMGRDYLKVGYYIENFFAERDIRYIAINDGVDSDKGDNDFTPFRNLFNDFYTRDTSKKIRAVMRAKGNAGEHLCTNPPYGYIKDPADKKKWIVDEEAAEIVERIFCRERPHADCQAADCRTRSHDQGTLCPACGKTAVEESKPLGSEICRRDIGTPGVHRLYGEL